MHHIVREFRLSSPSTTLDLHEGARFLGVSTSPSLEADYGSGTCLCAWADDESAPLDPIEVTIMFAGAKLEPGFEHLGFFVLQGGGAHLLRVIPEPKS